MTVSELLSAGTSAVKDLFNEVTTSDAANFIKDNIGVIGAGVGGVALGATVGALAANANSVSTKSKSTKRKSRRKSVTHRKKRKARTHRRRKPRYARTAGKRKDTSHKRIRQTKNGQPYIILASGKARFIKKSSARQSRKRKGGRY
jgi:hypothetical protein